MADDSDVPPLEDMTAVLKQAEAMRERRETKPSEVGQSGRDKAKARARVNKNVNAQAMRPEALASSDSTLHQGVEAKQEGKHELAPGNKETNSTEAKPDVKKSQSAGGFGGMKKGFLFGGPAPNKPKQMTKTANTTSSHPKPQNSSLPVNQTDDSKRKQVKEEIPYIKPNGKTESGLTFDDVQKAMSETKGLLDNQEWITDDLLNKVESNDLLLKRFADPKFMKALEEFQTNPTAAMEKYKGNTEVEKFLLEFCGLLGDHFTHMGSGDPNGTKSHSASKPTEGTAKTTSNTSQSTKASQGPKIVEISDDSTKSTNSLVSKDPKIVDLSEKNTKSDKISEIQVKAKPQTSKKSSPNIITRTSGCGADIQEVPTQPIGDAEVKEMLSDPKVMEILMDPKIMSLIQMLRSDAQRAQKFVDEGDRDLKEKVHFLVTKGLLQFQTG